MLFDRKHPPRGVPDTGPSAGHQSGGHPDGTDGCPETRLARHRNRMAGLWAAELLGLLGRAAHDYAGELAHAHEHQPDDESMVRRLERDLQGKASAHEIREKLAHLLHEAKRQLLREDRPHDQP
ncbi:MAG: ATPase inhibitor subunit zeta [Solirubrobacterales bacterium]